MMCAQYPAGRSASTPGQIRTKSRLRRDLRSQASRLALLSSIGVAAAAMSLLAPAQAFAGCAVGAVTVDCGATSTTDTTFPANAPNDRNYQGNLPTAVIVTVDPLAAVGGNGLAISNAGVGGVTVTNNGSISVNTGNTPTAGGTAALSVSAAGGAITYTGGNITNNGSGNAFDAVQTGGVGSLDINVGGSIFSATGEGITARDVATSTGVSVVTTGSVTALTAGKDGIDVQSQSLTGNLTEVANGAVQAGNAGMVAAILQGAATGDISVTANGSIDARFGIDAENFGSGKTSVTTVGPVTVTSGNGVFALSTGGDVTVTSGNVSSTGNTAIIAEQTKVAGAGAVQVTAGNVSGTTGVDAHNFGSGVLGVVTHGTVTGTSAEGVKAVGANAVSVTVDNTVTGATLGLSLIGGTGGTGNISVTGAGGFVGGTGDAANILNSGAGSTTVNVSGASSSTGGEGFFVRDTAAGGSISVTTGSVTALTAGKDGIDVQSQSLTGNLTEVANGAVQAGNAGMVAAILQGAATGDISVTANGSIDARFGIDAENFGSGKTSVTTVGPVTVTSGNGVFALSTGGDVTVTAGDVSSTGTSAIVAQNVLGAPNSGTINVSVTAGGTVNANAVGAFGVRTDSGQSSGTTTITVNGAIHAGAAGISSSSTRGNIVTNVSVTGVIDPLIGIDQTTVSGAITVNNAGLIAGANIGVRLTSTGAGAVGALTVNQASTGSISGAVGVDLGSLDAALAVNNAGLITGTTTAIRMTATGVGTATIVNSGTSTGGVNAVLASLNNTSFALTNTGILNGALNVSGSSVATSTVTNAAGGTINFGSGASSVSGSFANAGLVNIGGGGSVLFAGGVVNSNRINFSGAGSFATSGAMTNTGIINAQNSLTGNVVTVSGSYSGGGQFLADYSTVTATADHLNIGGAASGNTNVGMNRVGARSFVAGGFLPVVTVTPGAAATAFTSNTVFPTTGLVIESFGQNPSDNRQFGLIQHINPSAASLGGLTYAAESASMLLDEPISLDTTDPTHGGARTNLWIRATAGHTNQNIASAFTGGGITAGSVDEVRTDHQAVQLGADLGVPGALGHGWDVHLGITTGWIDGDARLSPTDKVTVEAPFIGGYVTVGSGGFAFDGTIRHEWRHYEVVAPSLFGSGAKQKADGAATAGSVHASYRIANRSGLAATPFLGFDYADSRINDLPIDASTAYAPGSHKTEVGQAGVRLSYRIDSEDHMVFEPFASASVLKNWSPRDRATFTFGAPVTIFTLDTKSWDDARRYSIGLLGHARDGRASAFLVGNFDDGSDIHGFTVNGGVRINF